VGDLLVAEVVAEPRNFLFEAKGVESFIADGGTAGCARFFYEEIPERRYVRAFDSYIDGRCAGRRVFGDRAGDGVDVGVDAAEIGERVEIYVRR